MVAKKPIEWSGGVYEYSYGVPYSVRYFALTDLLLYTLELQDVDGDIVVRYIVYLACIISLWQPNDGLDSGTIHGLEFKLEELGRLKDPSASKLNQRRKELKALEVQRLYQDLHLDHV